MSTDSPKISLPRIIEEIEELVGLAPALKLVDACGGTPVYLPGHLSDDHPLVKMLGPVAAWNLSQRHRGEVVDIPRCAALLRAKRNQDIRQRFDAGEPASKLARAYSMTIRNVWYILGTVEPELPRETTREDPRQGSLF